MVKNAWVQLCGSHANNETSPTVILQKFGRRGCAAAQPARFAYAGAPYRFVECGTKRLVLWIEIEKERALHRSGTAFLPPIDLGKAGACDHADEKDQAGCKTTSGYFHDIGSLWFWQLMIW